MKVPKIYFASITILLATSVILKLFANEIYLTSLFILLFMIHVTVTLYVIYSAYEMYFLHEKQGSKLVMSKDKLNINWN